MGSIDRSFFDRSSGTTASARDQNIYNHNQRYSADLRSLLDQTTDGRAHEELALYLMSCIAGCRCLHNQRTRDAQYDVYGSFEGQPPDFRSEVGRYFICECKSWRE